jgi:hypothetical protein
MSKKTTKKVVLASVLAGMLTVGAGATAAFGGFGQLDDKSREEVRETRESVRQAIEEQDYEAFQEAVLERHNRLKDIFLENMTEERFLEVSDRMNEKMQTKEALDSALENRNYDEWRLIIENTQRPRAQALLEVINEDNFDQFAQMHQLIKDGDYEGAREIKDDLGLKRPGMGVMGERLMPGIKDRIGGRFGPGIEPEETEERSL